MSRDYLYSRYIDTYVWLCHCVYRVFVEGMCRGVMQTLATWIPRVRDMGKCQEFVTWTLMYGAITVYLYSHSIDTYLWRYHYV